LKEQIAMLERAEMTGSSKGRSMSLPFGKQLSTIR
jgi:hypothetical protein